jgi:hypothetical protein
LIFNTEKLGNRPCGKGKYRSADIMRKGVKRG